MLVWYQYTFEKKCVKRCYVFLCISFPPAEGTKNKNIFGMLYDFNNPG